MLNRIAFLSIAAALAAAALPQAASAADYDDGHRPSAWHGEDGFWRDEVHAAPGGYRRAPGPVVFDERDPDRRDGRFAPDYGDPDGGGRFLPLERPASGDAAYGAGFGRGYGPDAGPSPRHRAPPAYRTVSDPLGRDRYDARAGLPDVGCTVQQAESTTAAGWRKIVTHRTCYRR